MNQREVRERLERLTRQMTKGCGNHGCWIAQPEGLGTNGACRCAPREIARQLTDIARQLQGMRWEDA